LISTHRFAGEQVSEAPADPERRDGKRDHGRCSGGGEPQPPPLCVASARDDVLPAGLIDWRS
jgi:hypothetical protein